MKITTFGLAGNAFMPSKNPADPNSEKVETLFENLTSYKNRNGGLWGRVSFSYSAT